MLPAENAGPVLFFMEFYLHFFYDVIKYGL